MLGVLGAWGAAGLATPVLLAACGGTAAVSSPTSAARVASAAVTAS